jgi:hypothetical protein
MRQFGGLAAWFQGSQRRNGPGAKFKLFLPPPRRQPRRRKKGEPHIFQFYFSRRLR